MFGAGWSLIEFLNTGVVVELRRLSTKFMIPGSYGYVKFLPLW